MESTGGIVHISKVPSLSSFHGFDSLRSIGGDLVIEDLTITSFRGLESVATIAGSLKLKNLARLTSFEGLDGLTRVGGSIEIGGVPLLTSFQGLRSLTEVGGDLILSLANLSSLAGLESLALVRGSIRLLPACVGLASLEGLIGLEAVQGDLELTGLSSLASLGGLENLAYVGGNLTLSEMEHIHHVPELANLTAVGGDLVVSRMRGLSSVDLTSLESIGGDFKLVDLDWIGNLRHLGALSSIGGAFSIDSTSLRDLQGLPSLTTIGMDSAGVSLSISNCRELGTTAGLSNLTGSLPGSVELSSNLVLTEVDLDLTSVGSDQNGDGFVLYNLRMLESLQGLGSLREIRGRLKIEQAPALRELYGLEQVTAIGGLFVHDTELETLDSLRSLTTFIRPPSYTASIDLTGNQRLISLAGLGRVSGALDGTIDLVNNQALPSLTGLEGITSVHSVRIANLQSIVDVKGLAGLKGAINGRVRIMNNDMLQSLQGLEGLTSIDSELLVQSCPNLETFAGLSALAALPVTTKIDDLPKLRSLHGFEGLRRMPHNPWDCSCRAGGGGLDCLVPQEVTVKFTSLKNLRSIAGVSMLVGWAKAMELDTPGLLSLQGLTNFTAQKFSVTPWDPDSFCSMPTEWAHMQALRQYFFVTLCGGALGWGTASTPAAVFSTTKSDCIDCSPSCGSLPSGNLIECDYNHGTCLCPLGTRGPGCLEQLPTVYLVPAQKFDCPLELIEVGGRLQQRTHCNVSVVLLRDPAPGNASGPSALVLRSKEQLGTLHAEAAQEGEHYSSFNSGTVQWLNATYGEIFVQITMRRRSQYDGQRRELVLFLAYAEGQPDSLINGSLLTGEFVTSAPKIWPWCSAPGGGCRATSPHQVEAILSMVGGKVSFLQPSLTVKEDGEFVIVILQRKGGDAGTVWVDVELDSQRSTATNGEDFLWTRQKLVWEDGDMSTKAIPVEVVNDPTWEPPETIVFQITNLVHEDFRGSSKQELVVTITDDADGGNLGMGPPFVRIREDDNNIEDCLLSVSRTAGKSGNTSVLVVLEDSVTNCGGGTAATRDAPGLRHGEADFNFTQGTAWLEWTDGDDSDKCVFGGPGASQMSVYSDWTAEPPEALCLSVAYVRGTGNIHASQQYSTITIEDIGEGGLRGTYLRCDRGNCTCAPGYYSLDASLPENCQRCEAGYICQGGTSRRPCPPGKSATQKDRICEDCAAGFFQDTPGSSSCKICPPGSFANSTGQSACHLCSTAWGAEGFVRVDPIDPDPEDCVCDQGTYLPCPGRLCRRGDYPPQGGCQPCPEGFVCKGFFQSSASIDSLSGPQEASSSTVSQQLRLLKASDDLVHGQPRLREGYFAPLEDPYCAVRCLNGVNSEKACPGERPVGVCGGKNREDDKACGGCLPDYYMLAGECVECTSGGMAFLPLAVFGLMFFLVAVTISVNRKERLQQRNGVVAMMSVASFVLFSMQFITLFEALPIRWSGFLGEVVKTCSSVTKIDLEILSPSCSAVRSELANYAVALAFYPFVFVVCLLTLALKHFCFRRKPGSSSQFRIEATHTLGVVGLTLFLSIISPIVQPFIIYEHPCSRVQSVADFPNVFVGHTDHSLFMVLGIIGCVTIPIPFTALAAWATWKFPVRFARRDTNFLHAFRFLFMKYRAESYHYSLLLIIRNLVLSLAPVVMRGDTLGQFMIIAATLFIHTAVQLMRWPWRIGWVNYVEMGMNIGLEHFMFLGAMLTDAPRYYLAEVNIDPPNIAGTIIVAILGCILATGLVWAATRVLFPTPVRSFFIIHAKQDASARARVLEMILEDEVKSPQRVLCGADQFKDLDWLIEVIRSQVRNVLILLTETTLSRPCLVGEIVVSHRLNVPMIVVRCSDFVPLDNVKEELPFLIADGRKHLAGYEMQEEHIVSAVEHVLSMESINESRKAGAEEMQALARAVLQRATRLKLRHPDQSKIEIPEAHSRPPRDQKIAIITDRENTEAVSNSLLLHHLLLPRFEKGSIFLQVQCGSEPFGFTDLVEYIRSESCKTVIFLVSGSFMNCVECLGLVLPAMQRLLGNELKVVPVMLSGFKCPDHNYFAEQLPQLLKKMGKKIKVTAHTRHGTALIHQFLSLCTLNLDTDGRKRDIVAQVTEVWKLVEGTQEAVAKATARRTVAKRSVFERVNHGDLLFDGTTESQCLVDSRQLGVASSSPRSLRSGDSEAGKAALTEINTLIGDIRTTYCPVPDPRPAGDRLTIMHASC